MKKNKLNNKNFVISKYIIILISILFLVGICMFINYKKVFKEHEAKIISYLTEKYNQNFEVNKLIKKCKYGKPLFDFDAPIDRSGECEYVYEIVSSSDNIVFNLHYLDANGQDIFLDYYIPMKTLYQKTEEIFNYVEPNIETNNKKEFSIIEDTDYFAFHHFKYSININSNQSLNKIISKEYIDKIMNLRDYIFANIIDVDLLDNKNGQADYFYTTLSINIHYSDKKYISLTKDDGAVRNEGQSVGGYEIYAYLNE